MLLACLDMEGVLVPEIWVNVAQRTGIEALRRTTRDEPDYDKLMQYRIAVMAEHGVTLSVIQSVISEMGPLPGAREFLDALRRDYQVVILSDTFYQFGMPLMEHLGMPTLFCHHLVVADDMIVGYRLRQPDSKTHAVRALQSLNFTCIATGDSYNDTGMLAQAEAGILFCPPDNVIAEFPQFPVTTNYVDLRAAFDAAAAAL
ncbi:bifunctional phosphoserine phosphatase/homoserine phosphotransferase ThrH [Propioniciclava tarda]|uniref:phosphoserine phosphatase n=1 Tax=Propioniciclava tarda TaxID=433330 RepID=A0A4Q9KKY2_PROTD|nr:bifunctional phosphoserine phosphatase/homoserine phosphotransferase ThrH [Propioniciclava tarda]TBT95162.1 bifunctional phosphoserine phosphatase/homoserine phosphotransferase ThrH [Propioniciclava tarda]SMO51488.1 phosphoserine phosphatase [Propioniciclava tarda]HOA88995.1 bifunctional phosphoserine phosphatase/homoserine phosphotransferase ThrH [Propioniciclava tarda]HQA30236.1 bifunctional phosphoserine phosphatase/homoserine phosphotransferase ThrH [Propioniciclava tarda]HQD60106.1 bif